MITDNTKERDGDIMPADMKTIIADTYTRLIQKGDIDKITVKNVIEECHISRQTFYYHFHDLMEVLEWSFEKAAEKLFQESLKADGLHAALERFVSFAYEHHREMCRLLNSRNSLQIEQMLIESVVKYLGELAAYKESQLSVSLSDMEISLYFYACGIVGTLLKYGGDPHLRQERLVKRLEELLKNNILQKDMENDR